MGAGRPTTPVSSRLNISKDSFVFRFQSRKENNKDITGGINSNDSNGVNEWENGSIPDDSYIYEARSTERHFMGPK